MRELMIDFSISCTIDISRESIPSITGCVPNCCIERVACKDFISIIIPNENKIRCSAVYPVVEIKSCISI